MKSTLSDALDARLLAVAEQVREGAVIADIGCDHGLLIGHLVASGRCVRGFACDLREKPLAGAREHLQALGLSGRVVCLQTDGLNGLPMAEIDDVVLAGMGGELIADILGREAACRDERLRFVLQPMTKANRLRRALYAAGFALCEEHGVRSGGFVYTVMVARYDGRAREVDELFAWTGLLPQCARADSRAMLGQVARKLQKKADGLRRAGREDWRTWQGLRDQVDDMISKGEWER